MPSFSQQDLLTYAQNRQKPGALTTLLASSQSLVSNAGKSVSTESRKVKKVKSSGKSSGHGKASDVFELFYDPQGGWKFGASIGSIGDHTDHVHVAADNGRIVYIGRHAQKMGLSVGENKHFSGSTPTSGHATNSYHYKDQAIDVSGSVSQMAAFARWVRRTYNLAHK